MTTNPYTRSPVHPNRFVGRTKEVESLRQFVQRGIPVALVGGPRVGKTSMLLKLMDERIEASWPGSRTCIWKRIELEPYEQSSSPSSLWHALIDGLLNEPSLDLPVQEALHRAKGTDPTPKSLQQLFRALDRSRTCLVLLLDEVERLLENPNFDSDAFWATLYAAVSRTKVLTLVVASRQPVSHIAHRWPVLAGLPSVKIGALSFNEAEQLLEQAGSRFDEDDRRSLLSEAGRHPSLLQTAARILYEAKEGDSDAELHSVAAEIRDSIDGDFHELWSNLDNPARLTAMILGQRALHNSRFSDADCHQARMHVRAFGNELEILREIGLAETGDRVGMFFDQDDRRVLHDSQWWTLAPQTFLRWMRDKAILDRPHTGGTDVRTILHISDLHIQTEEEAKYQGAELLADLRDLGVTSLDWLVISGDVAHRSTTTEYQAAVVFVEALGTAYNLAPQRLIIAPGNHDLYWKFTKRAYSRVACALQKLAARFPKPVRSIGREVYRRAAEVDEELYSTRFLNFSYELYRKLCEGRIYPLNADEQGVLHLFPEESILFVTLNSSWQIDHCYTERASINRHALTNVLRRVPEDQCADWLKIAVWHHPVRGDHSVDSDAFLERLAKRGFRLCLHGHLHKESLAYFVYNQRGLEVMGAGTIGALKEDRPPEVPHQYNLLLWHPDSGVITAKRRRRDRDAGAWGPAKMPTVEYRDGTHGQRGLVVPRLEELEMPAAQYKVP